MLLLLNETSLCCRRTHSLPSFSSSNSRSKKNLNPISSLVSLEWQETPIILFSKHRSGGDKLHNPQSVAPVTTNKEKLRFTYPVKMRGGGHAATAGIRRGGGRGMPGGVYLREDHHHHHQSGNTSFSGYGSSSSYSSSSASSSALRPSSSSARSYQAGSSSSSRNGGNYGGYQDYSASSVGFDPRGRAAEGYSRSSSHTEREGRYQDGPSGGRNSRPPPPTARSRSPLTRYYDDRGVPVPDPNYSGSNRNGGGHSKPFSSPVAAAVGQYQSHHPPRSNNRVSPMAPHHDRSGSSSINHPMKDTGDERRPRDSSSSSQSLMPPPKFERHQEDRYRGAPPPRSYARGRGDAAAAGRGMRRGSMRGKVSALQRLGPKLSVADRLGVKRNAVAYSKRQQQQEDKVDNNDSQETSMDVDGDSEKSKQSGVVQVTIRTDDKDETTRVVNDDDSGSGSGDRRFIKLECPHCRLKFVTFAEYAKHLHDDEHTKSMRQLKFRLQLTLGRMRTKQRLQQRELEKELDKEGKNVDDSGNKLPPYYCKICKLVFHQKRVDHNRSDMHKLITKFLNPVCMICDTQFFSPMAYETHLSTLAHIKKRSRTDVSHEEEDLEKTVEDSDAEEENFDMDSFMTLDEVGEVEEEEDVSKKCNDDEEESNKVESSSSKPEDTAAATVTTAAEVEVKKEEIKLDPDTPMGEEYVKRVEMLYCDLCHKYLPRSDPGMTDELLKSHCQLASHQTAFHKRQQEEQMEEEKQQQPEVAERDEIQLGQRQSFNDDDDQLDFEADESINGDVKSECGGGDGDAA